MSTSIPDVAAGRVVNGVTGGPIARALVQLGNRAILTDQEGRFRFEQTGQPIASLRVVKPGYSSSPEQNEAFGGAVEAPDALSIRLTLWPEALLAGVVMAPDGEPLQRISVQARRSVFDEQGHHFQVSGQGQTDSHGQFRIPVGAGDYVVETQFSPRGFERDEAILPAAFPPVLSNAEGETVHVGPGEEQHIELRPLVSSTHVVTLPFDAGDEGGPPRITARSSTGMTFAAGGARGQVPGALRISLPPGTFTLHATRFSREGVQFGESVVTVPDHDVTGPPLHLAALPSIPVDVVADSSGAAPPSSNNRSSATPPNLMQFNLVLNPVEVDPASPFQAGVRPTQQREGLVSIAAPPGVYRLNAGVAAGWYIRSATSRGTDLLREPLVISPSSSTPPITLTISNQVGSVQGTVTLSGAPAACWIYLVANGPAVPKVLIRRSDSTGSFRVSDLAPGSYRALAFPYRHSANLEDPQVLERYATHLGSFSVAAGGTESLELVAVPATEPLP